MLLRWWTMAQVPALKSAIEAVTKAGVRVLGEAKIGAHGLPVVFLHPKDCNGVLVELEEIASE